MIKHGKPQSILLLLSEIPRNVWKFVPAPARVRDLFEHAKGNGPVHHLHQ